MINDINAKKHTESLKNRIREDVETGVMLLERELLMDAALRAPSIEEEYRELNAESGSDALVSRAGDSSQDSDGRVRFKKSEETYLKNCVANPTNALRKGTQIKLGNRTFLKQMTHFRYTNRGKGGNEIEHEVGPYFDMFEGGTAGASVNANGITTFTVHPRGNYPLAPGEGKEGERESMIKSIRARFMFHSLSIQLKVRDVMERVLSPFGGDRKD